MIKVTLQVRGQILYKNGYTWDGYTWDCYVGTDETSKRNILSPAALQHVFSTPGFLFPLCIVTSRSP